MSWRCFGGFFLLFCVRFTCGTFWECVGLFRRRFQRRFRGFWWSGGGDTEKCEKGEKGRVWVRFSSRCFRSTCGTFWRYRGLICSRFLRRFGEVSLSGDGDTGETEKTRFLVRFSLFWVRFNRCTFWGRGRVFWRW